MATNLTFLIDQNPAPPMPTEVINKVEDNFDDFQKVVNLIRE